MKQERFKRDYPSDSELRERIYHAIDPKDGATWSSLRKVFFQRDWKVELGKIGRELRLMRDDNIIYKDTKSVSITRFRLGPGQRKSVVPQVCGWIGGTQVNKEQKCVDCPKIILKKAPAHVRCERCAHSRQLRMLAASRREKRAIAKAKERLNK
jgi:hypothetical protein